MNKKDRKFIITYKGIPFSGFTENGSQVIFNKGSYLFTKALPASAMKRKLLAVIKSEADVVGLTEVKFPFELQIEIWE